MITLRLDINEVNALYNALEWAKQNAEKTGGLELDELNHLLTFVKDAAEKDVSTWDGYVVNEVNTVLESLLPEAESGNIGIIYDKVEVERFESGPVYDDTKANGVDIRIVLKFKDTIQIK